MATAVVVRIKTTRKFGPGHIASIQKRVSSNSAAAAYNFARRVTSSARRRVHVITGRLKASIQWVRLAYGRFVVRVGMFYGVYEEYGTRYRPPHPYLRPAVEEHRRLFLQDMKKVFHR
jgi:phage protein, HK97 gp10 family